MSVTAILTGPASGTCGGVSGDFTITLSGPLVIDAVFTVTSSVGSDSPSIASPVTITAGATTGTFTVTPITCQSRVITITTTTAGVSIGTGTVNYDSTCPTTDCPNDLGTVAQSTTFINEGNCPSIMQWRVSPSTQAQQNLYGGTAQVNITISS